MTLACPSPKAGSLLLWAFVVLACIARFIHLDSDPKFENWIGYVTDEGRWVESARNLALFGELRLYGISKLHLVLSPGFQAVNYVIFELAGVSLLSARIWTAACGAGIVIFTFLLLRRIAPGLPLYLGLAILAFEPITLSLSRTALPEVPALLFTLLAFIAICTWKGLTFGAATGGLFIAIAIAMKGTTVLMTPVFLVMVALSGVSESARQRLLRCSAFLLGLLVPAMIGFALALAVGIINAETLAALWPTLRHDLAFGSIYTMVGRFVALDTEYGNVNLLLLGAWVSAWILIFRKEYRGMPLWTIYELSGIWAAGWLIVWGSNGYTPARYSVHIILPLAIHIVAGLGLWRAIGLERVLASIDRQRARWGIVFFAWLALPTAVIASNLLMAVAGLAGVPNDRLVYKLFAIVAIAVALAIFARATLPAGFIAFAVVAALLGTTIDQIGAIALSKSAAEQVLPIVKIAVFGGVAWHCTGRSTSTASLQAGTSAWALLCSLALAGLLLQSAPELLQPTYTIRAASDNIARLFPDAVLLQSSGAGTLLLETRIPYRDRISQDTAVDGLLKFDRHVKPRPEFVLVATYRLAVHPRYNSKSGPLMDSAAALVEVYRNVQPPRRPVAHLPSTPRLGIIALGTAADQSAVGGQ